MTPRSWNRREFDVTPAGFFTVLKPTGWFSALRLQGGSRYGAGESRLTAESVGKSRLKAAVARNDVPRGGGMPVQIVAPSAQEGDPIRLLLIVLAAAAMTLSVLWWMIPNNPWRVH